jgi:hypothetical protein
MLHRSRLRTGLHALFVAMAISPGAARAAPSSSAPRPASSLLVAETPFCRVGLVAVSYDDPGADDAEFLELHVDTFAAPPRNAGADAACSASPALADAAPDAHASADASGPTLGDCGLTALALIDGASAGCATYRTIPLSDVPIPADGYVVLCPAGSSVDARAHCDVTSAGRSALRAGWLQNGPNDGLRFLGADSRVALDVAVEGAPGCFDASAVSLLPETGQLGPDMQDDVNTVCDGHFVLLAEEDAPLRAPVRCPAVPSMDAGPSDAAVPDSTTAVDARTNIAEAGTDPWAPERAPAGPGHGTPSAYGPVLLDAGSSLLGQPRASLPRPPSCGLAPGALHAGRRGTTFASLLVAISVATRRRRRRRWLAVETPPPILFRRRKRRSPAAVVALVLRARCSGARCGSAPRRSPSR